MMKNNETLTLEKSNSSFAARLRQALNSLAVTQKRVAESGDVSQSTVSAYLAGQSQPAADVLSNWVRDFAINANWLLTGQGEMLLEGPSLSPGQVPADESSRYLSPAQREMLTYKRIQTELGMPKIRIAEGIELIIRGRYANGKPDPRDDESGSLGEMLDCAQDNKSG